MNKQYLAADSLNAALQNGFSSVDSLRDDLDPTRCASAPVLRRYRRECSRRSAPTFWLLRKTLPLRVPFGMPFVTAATPPTNT